jgi:CRP-like cAMP-binding protein
MNTYGASNKKIQEIPGGLSPEEFELLFDFAEPHIAAYKQGTNVFGRDETETAETLDSVGVVLIGRIEKLVLQYGHKLIRFGVYRKNSIICHMAPKTTEGCISLVAASDSCVAWIPYDALCAGANADERTRTVLFRFLRFAVETAATESRELSNRLFILFQRGLRERLTAYFTVTAAEQHSRVVDIGCSHKELAEYLGLNRCNMTQELGQMRKEGLIDYDKTVYDIKGMDR